MNARLGLHLTLCAMLASAVACGGGEDAPDADAGGGDADASVVLPDASPDASDTSITRDATPDTASDAAPDTGTPPDGCTPMTCATLGADCGNVGDGCGTTLDCGACATPSTCGAVVPNRCGCVPQTCFERGLNCGMTTDLCGTPLNCGLCFAPITCGGGGVDNVCGCTPGTCADRGLNCGAVADSCGGVLDCGICSGFDTCAGAGVDNVCGCTPKTCTTRSCGSLDDGCGAFVPCGTCARGSCGGGGTPNVCSCTTTNSAGPRSPGMGANDASAGDLNWLNPGNITAADATGSFGVGVARVRLASFIPASEYLVASNFGFAIPSTALINGIEVEILRASRESSPQIRDAEIKLVNRGVILEANRSTSDVWTDTLTYVTYGGAADLWGHDWTPTDINHVDFGAALMVAFTGGAGNDDAFVDHIRVTVHYALTCP